MTTTTTTDLAHVGLDALTAELRRRRCAVWVVTPADVQDELGTVNGERDDDRWLALDDTGLTDVLRGLRENGEVQDAIDREVRRLAKHWAVLEQDEN